MGPAAGGSPGLSPTHRAAGTASDPDLDLVERAARAAGATALRYFRRGIGWDTKTGEGDRVSDADRAAEASAVAVLRRARPSDGLLGEEGSTGPQADLAAGGRRWVVDAVDGTFNFLAGVAYWCAAVALEDADGPVVSAIFDPVTGESAVAGRGRGAWVDGRRLPPLPDVRLGECSLATYLQLSPTAPSLLPAVGRLAAAAATIRVTGSGSQDLLAVARGRVGAWVQSEVRAWDWLPGSLMVREAGGVAGTLDAGGRSWCVAGNATAVGELVAVLRSGSA